jgi:RNA polymerase sigma factor (sigma-70 family)
MFSDLVRQNQAAIYRICRAYLYDRSHAEDLYQEILLQIWNSLSNYKGTAQVSTWIYRIAVNTAITYNIRNKKTHLEPLPDSFNIAEDNPGHDHEKESQLSRLTWAISQLEEKDRLIISLVLEDLSYKEIAEITGSNTNNIGVRITRIKTRIMKLMTNQIDNNEL